MLGCLLLQDKLGRKARMALIICCSPAAANDWDTLSSLRFGSHVKDTLPTIQVFYRLCPLAQLKRSKEPSHCST